jgi:hypothetical protein
MGYFIAGPSITECARSAIEEGILSWSLNILCDGSYFPDERIGAVT